MSKQTQELLTKLLKEHKERAGAGADSNVVSEAIVPAPAPAPPVPASDPSPDPAAIAAVPALLQKNECVVCKDAEAMLAAIPCGHLCVCAACADKIHGIGKTNECPNCRRYIVMMQRIYA